MSSAISICRTLISNNRGRFWRHGSSRFLDRDSLTVRKAGKLTGIAAADFSRIRKANLRRVTVDCMMTILGRLDQRVDVHMKVRLNVVLAPSQR